MVNDNTELYGLLQERFFIKQTDKDLALKGGSGLKRQRAVKQRLKVKTKSSSKLFLSLFFLWELQIPFYDSIYMLQQQYSVTNISVLLTHSAWVLHIFSKWGVNFWGKISCWEISIRQLILFQYRSKTWF